jgi:hypothetical protein
VTPARAVPAVHAVRGARAAVGALVALLGTTACSGSDLAGRVGGGRAAYAGTDTMGVVPSLALRIKVHAPKELVENSGAVLSRTQPGVVFVINDSGNDPLLFAVDTTGAGRGVWRVARARNSDWEAVSVGPCAAPPADAAPATSSGPSGAPPSATATPSVPDDCVYIGDVGDNGGTYATRIIYKVGEPAAQHPGFVGLVGDVRAERLRFRYSDHPHDVEAMYVAPNADIFLLTKRALTRPGNELRPTLVFQLHAAAWGRDTAVADLVDSLPIVPGSAPLRQITDAALSPDGRMLAVRTYAQVYVFATDSITGRVRHTVPPAVCNIVPLGRWQGEGVAWFGRSGKLLLTSEGRRSPMFAVDCPLPRSE